MRKKKPEKSAHPEPLIYDTSAQKKKHMQMRCIPLPGKLIYDTRTVPHRSQYTAPSRFERSVLERPVFLCRTRRVRAAAREARPAPVVEAVTVFTHYI